MDAKLVLIADALRKAGISVIVTNKEKRPVGEWKGFQASLPTRDELDKMCASPFAASIATIGGAVSGGLEILDFEGKDKVGKCVFQDWKEIINSRYPDLFASLVLNSTPSGGVHARYRYKANGNQDGNKKLAFVLKEKKKTELIETRGEGGYALCPPSPKYEMMQGDITKPPTLLLKERNFLLSIARSFNEVGVGVGAEGFQPGDDFNQRSDHRALLEKHGWMMALARENGTEYWRRPGKEESWSATWNFYPGCFYVFSSNADPFEAEKSYNLFAVFAYLEHNGDFKAAAKALGEQGYGEKKKKAKTPATPKTNAHSLELEPTEDISTFPVRAIQDFNILTYRCTDSGNAELFAELHGQNFRYDHTQKRWYRWNGVFWQIDQEKTVVQRAKQTARFRLREGINIGDDDVRAKHLKWAIASESNAKIESCLSIAKTEQDIATTGDIWDKNKWLLGVQNGVVDLNDGTLRQSQRDDYITLVSKISYDEYASCSRWKQFLEEVFQGNQKIINYIQRAMGYALTGIIKEHCLFLCHGTGRNGKSTLLNTIGEVLGSYATGTPFSTFEMNRYQNQNTNDLAALRGVRFVSARETQETRRLNEARIKAITGGDPITCRYLYAEFFTYTPNFKVWLSVNHKPVIFDTSEGMWSRVRLIPFEVSFRGREDKDLDATLNNELPGILNWAIEGCLEWQKGGLNEPAEVLAATARYRAESDIISQFIEECTGPAAEVKSSDLYNGYTEWCKTNGEKPLSGTAFGKRMTEKGYVKEKKGNVFYKGLGLVQPLMPTGVG